MPEKFGNDVGELACPAEDDEQVDELVDEPVDERSSEWETWKEQILKELEPQLVEAGGCASPLAAVARQRP